MRKKSVLILSLVLILTGCNNNQATSETSDTVLNNDSAEKVEKVEKPYHEAYAKMEPIKLFDEPSKPIENTKLRNFVIYFENADYKISKTQSAMADVSIGDIQNAKAKIEVFGNSTSECAKRPIKVKFNDAQMLGNGGKKYYLISNIYDKSLIHNYVTFELAKYMNVGCYVPSYEYVNVYANYEGQEGTGYQGVYLMSEKIQQEDYDSYDLKYVFEQDYRVYFDDPDNGKEDLDWFWLGDNYIECFSVRGKVSEEVTNDIKNKLENIWDILGKKDWNEIQRYVDVENIAKCFLIDEIVKDKDVGQTSIYWGIKNDGRLCIASIWDNDLSFGSGGHGAADSDLYCLNNVMFERIYAVPEFKEYYRNYYNEHCEEWYKFMIETVDSVSDTYYDDFVNDYEYWEKNYHWCNEDMKDLDYPGQIQYMKDWLRIRIDFLKGVL